MQIASGSAAHLSAASKIVPCDTARLYERSSGNHTCSWYDTPGQNLSSGTPATDAMIVRVDCLSTDQQEHAGVWRRKRRYCTPGVDMRHIQDRFHSKFRVAGFLHTHLSTMRTLLLPGAVDAAQLPYDAVVTVHKLAASVVINATYRSSGRMLARRSEERAQSSVKIQAKRESPRMLSAAQNAVNVCHLSNMRYISMHSGA